MAGYWTIIKTYRNGLVVFCPKCENGNIYFFNPLSTTDVYPDIGKVGYPYGEDHPISKCRNCDYKDLSEKFPTLRELRINRILE